MRTTINGTMGAFSRAMLDQVAEPSRDVRFEYSVVGGQTFSVRCHDFVRVRFEEERLIRECLAGKDKPRVLDIGCGIGRHSALVRRLAPEAEITLVESDPDLRAYARVLVPRSVGHACLEDLPRDAGFDLVLLLGNGLGLFGTEHETLEGLKQIHGMMSQGGRVLVESGNYSKDDFDAVPVTLRYGDVTDSFTWGYATRSWVQGALGGVGFDVVSLQDSSQQGAFFIVHAKKRGEGAGGPLDDEHDWPDPGFDPRERPRIKPDTQGGFWMPPG